MVDGERKREGGGGQHGETELGEHPVCACVVPAAVTASSRAASPTPHRAPGWRGSSVAAGVFGSSWRWWRWLTASSGLGRARGSSSRGPAWSPVSFQLPFSPPLALSLKGPWACSTRPNQRAFDLPPGGLTPASWEHVAHSDAPPCLLTRAVSD